MKSRQCRLFAAIDKKEKLSKPAHGGKAGRKQRIVPVVALGAATLLGSSLGWAEENPSTLPASGAQPESVQTAPAPAPVPQQSSDAESNAAHPEVVVSGEGGYKREKASSPKYTEPLRDIPQTITVIPKEVMQDQGATSMRQVLRNVPGISMQAGEGGVPAGDNLTIRGFNARTDFFSDGMRDLGGYFRDPFNLESVEVSKGPSSTSAGRGSTGGSINQVSKWPEIYKDYGASFGMGTDNYKRGTIDVNQPIDEEKGTAIRINAMWHENDVPRRETVDNKRWGFAPSIAFGLGTPTRLTLGFYHLSQDNTPDYGIPWVPEAHTVLVGDRGRPAPVDLSNFYGLQTRDYEKTTSDVFTGQFEHDFNDSLTLHNITRSMRAYRDSVITAPRFVSNSVTTLNRQFQSRDQQDDIIANQTNLVAKFDTGFIGHSAVLGTEVSREKQFNHLRTAATAPTADLYNPDPYELFAGGIRRIGTTNEAIADSRVLYAFDTLKLGEHVEIPLGLRWESFDVKFTSATSGVPDVRFRREDKMLSGRAGLVIKPTDNGSIYAGYGTSFNPSAEGLTSGFNATSANVEPEESRSYEVGTKWDVIRRRLALSTALFRTEKTNARTPGVNPGDAPTILEGEQRVDGVEIGASGNLTRNWQLFSGATFMKSEIRKSNTAAEKGQQLSNTPKSSYSVWTSYQFPTNLQIGAGAQYTSKRFGNNTNTREVGSYIVYDAMMSYPVNENVSLRLNVYNIGDEEYFDSLGGGHLIPGAGRSATVTTDIRFGQKSS